MKSLRPLLVIGALLGFLMGFGLGLANRSAWPSMLWRSSAAALGLGVMMRWWGRCWTDGLRVAQRERLAALAAQRQEHKEQKPQRATKP